jgi:predicted PurR-regulated permease PerM
VLRPSERRVNWGALLFYGAVVLLAAWLVWAGRAVWLPVGIAFVIAIVLDPLVDRLENRGISRGLATALVFVVFIGSAVVTLLVLTPIISEQAGDMASRIRRLFPDPNEPDLVPVTQTLLNKLNANPALRDPLLQAAQAGTDRLSQAFSNTSTLVLAWAPNLAWVIVVPVLAFYALVDFHRIYAKAVLLVPPKNRPLAQTLIAEISAVFGKYLRGLAQLCFMLGLAIAMALWALGNPYWPVLGLMGGVLYAVPVVGSMFTIAVVVLVGLVTTSPSHALLQGGAVLLLSSGLFDQVVTPRVLGKQVGLHPILTILALLLGYQIWGLGGMLVAVPVAACVQTVVIHLIPKLGIDLELRPLVELRKTEAETREAHMAAEERLEDDHLSLNTVVENVESQTVEAA